VIRIEGTPGQFGDLSKERVGDKRKSGSASRASGAQPAGFAEELRAAVELSAEDPVQPVDWRELIARVDAAGRELLARPDAKRFAEYKKAVRGFLAAMIRRTYRVRLVEGRGPNPKLFVHVERIEAKLDEMARTVLASQASPLRLLAQVEELRGLLLDLRS
jgi:uncharacterized protein YaaR (DUF327 family)